MNDVRFSFCPEMNAEVSVRNFSNAQQDPVMSGHQFYLLAQPGMTWLLAVLNFWPIPDLVSHPLLLCAVLMHQVIAIAGTHFLVYSRSSHPSESLFSLCRTTCSKQTITPGSSSGLNLADPTPDVVCGLCGSPVWIPPQIFLAFYGTWSSFQFQKLLRIDSLKRVAVEADRTVKLEIYAKLLQERFIRGELDLTQ